MTTESTGKKSLRAVVSWGFDKAVENWPAIAFFLATGGGMTYLASISDWFKPYGPAGWVLFACLVLLVLTLVYLGYANARLKISSASFSALKAQAGKINTLQPIHEYERVNLSDLYHPFFKPIKNARFQHCEFFGPGNIVLRGCNLANCLFDRCEVVIVRPEARVVGVAAMLEDCVLLDSSLFQVTLLMNRASWNKWPEELRNQITVISEAVA